MAHVEYAYPLTVTRADDGVTITFPDVPEAITGAPTHEVALAGARDCLETALAGRIADGQAVPASSPAAGRPVMAPGAELAAKLALYQAMRERGLTAADLAGMLGTAERTVRHLLDPAAAVSIQQLEAALEQLGRRVVVSIETG